MAKLNRTDMVIRLSTGTEANITKATAYGWAGEPAFATDTNNLWIFPTTEGTPIKIAGASGVSTLANVATNSTTTAHQTFALDAATSFIIEDSGGTDILTIVESSGLATFRGGVESYLDSSSNFEMGPGVGNAGQTYTDNVFIGANVGAAATTATLNVGIASGALQALTDATGNVAIGRNTLNVLDTGDSNIAIGADVLIACTSGFRNVGIGNNNPLGSLTTGSSNVAIGNGPATNLTDATDCVFIGTNAGGSGIVTGATQAVGIGTDALKNLTSGTQNIAIGREAGDAITTGGANTAIGMRSLSANISGSSNTAIGRESGFSATGSANVFVGYRAGKNETGSNTLYIANSDTATPLIYGAFSTGLLTFHTADAGTTTVVNTVSLEHLSSGTPAAGFGAAYRIGLESTTTDDQDAVRLIGKWTTATHATRAAEGALTAYYTSTERTPIRWGANSSAATLGFYNTSPISQPSGTGETTGFTAGAGTGVNDDSTFTGNVGSTAYRISDIVKHLKNLGLLAQ